MKVVAVFLLTFLASFCSIPSDGVEVGHGNLRKLLAADSNFTGCIEVQDGKAKSGAKAILGTCANHLNGVDPEELGNGLVHFHSRRNSTLCMQAGLKKVTLKVGDEVRFYECNKNNILQTFYWTGGNVQTAYKRNLCLIYHGNVPNVGKDTIVVQECKKLVDFGWSED